MRATNDVMTFSPAFQGQAEQNHDFAGGRITQIFYRADLQEYSFAPNFTCSLILTQANEA